MFSATEKDRRTFEVYTAEDYLPSLVEAFLLDRRTQGLSGGTVKFYHNKLKRFTDFAESQALTQLSELTPDFLRQFILFMGEGHNPGGVHAAYRSLKAFLRWVEFEEVAPDGWKNPIRKVKSPRVPIEIGRAHV